MNRALVLTASITGAVIVALDGTALTVAQPSMQRSLDATFVQVQWTSTAYLIAVASLLVFAGRLGDRYGHRRVFGIGVLGFAATSAAIGFATDVRWVIGLRAAQGVFGALLQPATLGMLRASYPSERLGMAIALRTSAIGLAAATGPLVGGALAAQLGWRWVFFLSVVPALAVGAVALAVRTPEPRDGAAPGFDLPGACLLAAALAGLVHTLVGVPEAGWTTATGLSLAVATAAGIAFVRHERRTASPLIPSSVFRSRAVSSALGVLLCASSALFGALFLGTYFLQEARGLDPLGSAVAGLPLAVTMVLGAPVSAGLQRRLGPRRTAVAGMALVALGVFLLSRLDQTSSYATIGAGFLVLGAGFVAVMVTATAVVVHAASVSTAGVSGGLQQTAMNVGPALGVAAATMLMTFWAPADVRPPGAEGPRWSAEAFVSGMGPALTALAAVGVLGALLATRIEDGATHRAAPDGDRQPASRSSGAPSQRDASADKSRS
ncbi:MFS transporter [Streptomyces sp. NPDC051907]|uniref:MFS transporter n=1 Tax=Streptomyces sp. NPDC051907 TaxID=3155284 RepID=UPI00341A8963